MEQCAITGVRSSVIFIIINKYEGLTALGRHGGNNFWKVDYTFPKNLTNLKVKLYNNILWSVYRRMYDKIWNATVASVKNASGPYIMFIWECMKQSR